MKNNWITALTLGALLCLPACWCKKQCKLEKRDVEAASSVTQVAIMEDIDAYNSDLLVLDEEPVRVASTQSKTTGSIKF